MRSIVEHEVAKFFHQKYGIALYPYPGDEADLRTPCGLDIEVKLERPHKCHHYRFKGEQVYRKQFDLAILVRKRNRWLQYAIWSLPDIQALIVANDGFPGRKALWLRPQATLTWQTMTV